MSLKADLFDALRGLVSDRCYPDTFPQEPNTPTWPAIRYTVAGGTITGDICGSGTEETDDIRMQIDAVAVTHKDRDALKTAIRAALLTFSPPCVLDSPSLDRYDSETKTFISSQDFIFSGSSP